MDYPRSYKIKPESVPALIKDWNEGVPANVMAERYGVKTAMLLKYAKKLGLPNRPGNMMRN